jgi:(1->4)-alpha-D-glucan 1-alpha-D-glucosylmutase
MQQRVGQPPGLLATATHDTKRGEDARARLYALAEQPSVWAAAVSRWRAINAPFRQTLERETVPDPETEWLLYQALAGLWPAAPGVPDADALRQLAGRFEAYVGKALREAKLRTDWLEPNEPYETAVQAYASRLLDPGNADFLDDFAKTLQSLALAGAINSASQTLVKLTAPGIPDIYQGSEGLDLSLVDPDNRRCMEGDLLSAALDRGIDQNGLGPALLDGTFKQWMIARCLAWRATTAGLFTTGTYVPLAIAGSLSRHFAAFMRENEEMAALVVVQRLPLPLMQAPDLNASYVELPARYRGVAFRGVLARVSFTGAEAVPVQTLFGGLPVSLSFCAAAA